MMAIKKHVLWASLVAIPVALATGNANAEDAAKQGKDIATEADRRTRGFGDSQAKLTMQLSDRRGQTSKRLLDVSTLEDSGTEKALIYFTSPRDVRGTALLSFSHRDKDDEQWLYLPALRRNKRIAAANRSSPFMGSEFSYEDLSAQHVSDFSYRYLGDEEVQKTPCFVVERIPRYEGTGYKKQKVWFDKAEYRVVKIEFWDKKGRKLKTLVFGRYAKYLDSYWEPGVAKMVNHQTKAVTTLTWANYRFHTGLKKSDFDQSALRKTR